MRGQRDRTNVTLVFVLRARENPCEKTVTKPIQFTELFARIFTGLLLDSGKRLSPCPRPMPLPGWEHGALITCRCERGRVPGLQENPGLSPEGGSSLCPFHPSVQGPPCTPSSLPRDRSGEALNHSEPAGTKASMPTSLTVPASDEGYLGNASGQLWPNHTHRRAAVSMATVIGKGRASSPPALRFLPQGDFQKGLIEGVWQGRASCLWTSHKQDKPAASSPASCIRSPWFLGKCGGL